jgi:hypothetical protein
MDITTVTTRDPTKRLLGVMLGLVRKPRNTKAPTNRRPDCHRNESY